MPVGDNKYKGKKEKMVTADGSCILEENKETGVVAQG